MKTISIPKIIGLIVVSLGLAYLMQMFERSQLEEINSMSPTDYVQQERGTRQDMANLPYWAHFLIMVFYGAIYILVVETVAYRARRMLPKKLLPPPD